MNALIVILIMVFCSIVSALASLFMKIGSEKFIIKITIKGILAIIKNWRLILGSSLYVISAVVFILILKNQKLSFLYPLSSLTYVFITILSGMILKENINRYKIIGISFIILGVILTGFP